MTSIYIKTFGCALNKSDSELMAGLLKKADFEIVNNVEDAFIIILNTCAVKKPSETSFFKKLQELKDKYKYKKIIVTGCIPQVYRKKLTGYPLLGPSRITEIVSLVEEVLNNNPISMLKKEKLPRLNLPKVRKNKVIEIIPICEGCLGDPCSYCIVKKARGTLRSYPKEEIISQVKAAVKDHIPEIWLTAQDAGCYGKDIGSSLPSLLKEIVSIPGNFKIRLGMLNPNHAKEFLPELLEIYRSEKMFKFIHIPVQAGDDAILKSMKRHYTVAQFTDLIHRIRYSVPYMTIATDLICGFPGETDKQFFESIELMRKISPDVLNISRFWPRPGTAAAKMEGRLHGTETKRRSRVATDIFRNISMMQNEKWKGWQGEILIDEKGKDGTLIGRNFAYKQVIVKGNFELGEKLQVKVNKVSSFDLRGDVLL